MASQDGTAAPAASHTKTAATPSGGVRADMTDILAPALAPRQARVRGFLHRLADAPPQVLLMEGGTADEREAMSLYWAALLNCTLPAQRPCLACTACAQMIARQHRDMFFLDGREGSIKIDDVRAIRAVLGEPPRDDGQRMVILAEAQALGIEAANALLKSLEEPRPGTSFVLLAPQRERLLPTLVSRSWVLTLAWPQSFPQQAEPSGDRPDADPAAAGPADSELAAALTEWTDALALFAVEGTGWFQRTSSKGSLDNLLGQHIIARCQRELAAAIIGHPCSALARLLADMGPARQRKLDEVLAECQESLAFNVNPALVMDWLATRLTLLAPRTPR